MSVAASSPVFCDDSQLGYLRSRTIFTAETGLTMDDAYRLAHLPLLAPEHPKATQRAPGKFYDCGRHANVFSLVLPIDGDALERAEPYRRLVAEMRAASFAQKIDWSLLTRRRDKLHATICGSLAQGETPPTISPSKKDALRKLGPINVELRGLFSGNVNIGRLYLRAYPERRDAANMFHCIQQALGRPLTDLHVVGLFNFIDDLSPDETSDLAALLDRWWAEPILRFPADRLWLLGSRDDLVLDAAVGEVIPLA